MPTIRHFVVPAILLFAAGAQAGDLEDAVDYRQGVMNVFSWNAGHMAAMVKGEAPFDAAAFKGYAEDLAAAAKLDVIAGFPDDSVSDESDAMDEIWLNQEDFEQKFQALQEQSAKLAEVAAGGDEAAMKEQFGKTGKTCKGCHDDYKN